jgi:hypothetical protein
MKLKMIALAAALVASIGGANAQVIPGGSEVLATISDGANQAVTFDLGVLSTDLFAAASTSAVSLDWNLYTGAFTDNSVTKTSFGSALQTSGLNYAGHLTAASALVTSTAARISAFGGDGLLGPAGSVQYVTTEAVPLAPNTLTNGNLSNFSNLYNFMAPANQDGSQAYTFVTADTQNANYNNFASFAGVGGAPAQDVSLASAASGVNFYRIINSNASSSAYVSQASFAKLTFNASTGDLLLTSTVAAVPEAETYAMLLAGLGAIGTIIRRRRTV